MPNASRWILVLMLVVGCTPRSNQDPRVKPQPPAEDPERRDALAEDFDLDTFLEINALPFRAQLSYAPLDAEGLDTVQDSELALDTAELEALDRGGVVISDRLSFMSFGTGYEQIYKNDLPIYITADSLLHAVHRSYDAILQSVETTSLAPELHTLLTSMRQQLANGRIDDFDATTRVDVDAYLAVALSLLEGAPQSPVAGADAGQIAELVSVIQRAGPPYTTRLFGVDREIDTSQFTPRGHYAHHPTLEPYFQAMMWLGRVDMRFVEVHEGQPVVQRRQLAAAFALRRLMNEPAHARWAQIDTTIGVFVGPHDSMSPEQLDALLTELEVTDAASFEALSDDAILAASERGYGHQRIASHLAYSKPGAPEVPRPATFLMLGQRYVVDSHVLSEVVYDRFYDPSFPVRMMPNPLDVAYAALGNDAAAGLLSSELEHYGYASALQAMRAQVDGEPGTFWEGSLYTLWLSALRELSPRRVEVQEPLAFGMPEVTGTQAWSRRMLNTQLASWAELRRDTLLYAKQSYTMVILCEFPDAYVDPYPDFWLALQAYAVRGRAVLASLEGVSPAVVSYFDRLDEVSGMLADMAQYQREGRPFTEEHMAFVNDSVRIQEVADGCTTVKQPLGWYPKLFFDEDDSVEFDPTIADVHTQPTDELGNPVGKVLHVGTGKPRMMVVTVDTCHGVRAYAGLVSSYFETVTDDYQRLDDAGWASTLREGTPVDVTWMQESVVR